MSISESGSLQARLRRGSICNRGLGWECKSPTLSEFTGKGRGSASRWAPLPSALLILVRDRSWGRAGPSGRRRMASILTFVRQSRLGPGSLAESTPSCLVPTVSPVHRTRIGRAQLVFDRNADRKCRQGRLDPDRPPKARSVSKRSRR